MKTCYQPADGHGDDDWLPAGVEEFSGGGDLPGYQHPQGAQRHKDRTHQRVGVVIVLCRKKKKVGSHRLARVDGQHFS